MRTRYAPLIAMALASLSLSVGCGSGASGTLKIDGRVVEIQSCVSTEHVHIPNQIDVTTSAGTYRFAVGADGQAEISYLVSALVMPAGIPIPLQRRNVVSHCGPITITAADYRQGDAYPLSGSATIRCDNLTTSDPSPHSFEGSITFDGCH